MRWRVRTSLVVGLSAWFCAALIAGAQSRDAAGPPPQTGTLSIVGHVVLADTTPLAPVRRARVTLMSDGAVPAKTTDTDTDGAFRFDNLPAGAYRLLPEKPGFVPLDTGPPRGVVRPMPVTLASPAEPITVTMQRASALEGVLLTDKGEPAASVVVSAVRIQYGAYGRRPSVVKQATTDDLGRFRIHTLPAGDYYISSSDSVQPSVQPAPTEQWGFARYYYPGTNRIDEARQISLSPGQDVTNLEFRVTPVQLASISGTVVDSSRKTASTMGIRIQRLGWPPGELRAVSGRGGSFVFPSVTPGDYWLLASVRPGAGSEIEYAAMRLSVAGQDFKDVTLTTSKSLVVPGRIEVEGNATMPSNLQVVAAETDYELPPPGGTASMPAPGTVAADGTFTLSNLFGNRLFRIDRLPANWALKSVFVDSTDVTDTPVDLAALRPQALRLVITNRTATISGSLESNRGGPTAGRIVVFSEDARRWGLRSRVIRTVEVQADGRYSVTGLLAGRYFIIGVEELDDLAWNDPEVLSRLQATAISLTLTEGQKLTLTLQRR